MSTQARSNLRSMIFLVRLFAVYGRVAQFDRAVWDLRRAVARLCDSMAGDDIEDWARDDITDHVTDRLVSIADLTRSEGEVVGLARLMIRRRLFRIRLTRRITLDRAVEIETLDNRIPGSDIEMDSLPDRESVEHLCMIFGRVGGKKFQLLLERLEGRENPEIAEAHGMKLNAVKSAISRAKAILEVWYEQEQADSLPAQLRADVELLRWEVVERLDDPAIAARLDIDVEAVKTRRRAAWHRVATWMSTAVARRASLGGAAAQRHSHFDVGRSQSSE